MTETIRKASNIDPIYKNMCEWYQVAEKLASSIDSIVSIEYNNANELEIARRILLKDNTAYDIIIIIQFNGDSVNVKLKNHDTYIDDIIEEGKMRNENMDSLVSFYIKEICWRVANMKERVNEFQKLKLRYGVKYTEIESQGQVEIILNDIPQSMLLFQIDSEYPRAPGCFELVKSSTKNESLNKLKEELSKEYILTVTDALNILDS